MRFFPVCDNIVVFGGVAQLGERLNGIQEVKSSILSVSTKNAPYPLGYGAFFVERIEQDGFAKQNANLSVNGWQGRVRAGAWRRAILSFVMLNCKLLWGMVHFS